MKKLLNQLTLYFKGVPEAVRKRTALLWVFFIVLTAFFFVGLFRIPDHFDMTMESWFSADDPVKLALDRFRDEFGSDDGIFIAYKPKDGDIFSEASLKAVQGIRRELMERKDNRKKDGPNYLNHIKKIDTIVSANILKVQNDTLVSRKFIGDTIPSDQAAREQLRKEAKKQKTFSLLYYSKDFQYGGISIQTDFGTIPLEEKTDFAKESGEEETDAFEEVNEEQDMSMEVDKSAVIEKTKYKPTEVAEYVGLMDEIDITIYKPEYADHLDYYPVGSAPLMQIFMKIMEEMGPMYMGMLLVMIILLWFLFKSLSAVVWPILVVVLSCIWMGGIIGWLGITVTNMITLTIMLILAVGIADTIHIISGYLHFRNKGMDHKKALDAAFEKSALPCLLTSVTTSIGMLALTLTPITHIAVFGFSSAAGVMMAYMFTIYLLPLMLDLWSPVAKKNKMVSKKKPGKYKSFLKSIDKLVPDSTKVLSPLLSKVLPIVERRPGTIIIFFASILLICIYGATQVKIDSNFIEATREGHRLRIVYDVVDKHMMGAANMEVLVDMGREDALQDPKVILAMETLQSVLIDKYGDLVVRTYSLSDVVKDAYQALNEDREEMHVIPETKQMLTQTLFMFNNANPEDRRKLVSDNYDKSHISIQLYNTGSYEYTEFFRKVKIDIHETFKHLKPDYPSMDVSVTGGLALIMELTDYISKTQLRSLGLAIVTISIILIVIFGSIRVGILSIIPNLLPATLTFGLLGLFDIPLDSDTIIIAPVIIGIAVDDTIHFITHYRGEVLKNRQIHRSLKNTIEEVGQAITFTTLILGFGFAIMSFSSYMSMVKVGIFGSMAIFTALICDLFLIPSLILVFKPRFLNKDEKKALKAAQALEV